MENRLNSTRPRALFEAQASPSVCAGLLYAFWGTGGARLAKLRLDDNRTVHVTHTHLCRSAHSLDSHSQRVATFRSSFLRSLAAHIDRIQAPTSGTHPQIQAYKILPRALSMLFRVFPPDSVVPHAYTMLCSRAHRERLEEFRSRAFTSCRHTGAHLRHPCPHRPHLAAHRPESPPLESAICGAPPYIGPRAACMSMQPP